jgi:hypothetical protein
MLDGRYAIQRVLDGKEQAPRGLVTISLPHGFGGAPLAAALVGFHQHYPGRSITRISFYLRPSVATALAPVDHPVVNANNTCDRSARRGTDAIAPQATMEIFHSTIEAEDYSVGVHTQRAAESGPLPYLIFGRNEPALHYFQRCFSDAPGLEPPEVVSAPPAKRAAGG